MKPIRKNLLQMKTVSAVRLDILENIAMQVLLQVAERALQDAEPLTDEAKALLWYFEFNGVDAIDTDDSGNLMFVRAPIKDVENIAETLLAAGKILPPGGARH